MNTHIWAKIAGWSQFGITTLGQVAQGFSQGGVPRGAFSWITFFSSLVTAVAVHGAASTDGTK